MSMAQTAHFLEAFEQLCSAAHTNSKDKGFWNPDPATGGSPDNVSIPTKILLMVSELLEAFEAYRKGTLAAPCDKEATTIDPKATEPYEMVCVACNGTGFSYPHHAPANPCHICKGDMKVSYKGVRRLTNEEEELADLAIRLADYCEWRGVNLGRVILSKMAYNKGRPYRHNKVC
jgi:NTP pyrophosphatase (non-canonical NTP hydrolase)